MNFQPDDSVWSFVPPYPNAKVKVGHWTQLKVGHHLDAGGMANLYKQPPWPASKTLIKVFKEDITEVERQIFFAKIRAMSRLYPNLSKALCGPPPMKWSDSKYGIAIEEDCHGEEAQAGRDRCEVAAG